jgi:hypothetical protein
MPFDITAALTKIMAYKWLNVCDGFPFLKDFDGPRMLRTMFGESSKKEEENASWWISKL